MSGRGGNTRRSGRNRAGNRDEQQLPEYPRSAGRRSLQRGHGHKLQWVPPQRPTEPLPAPVCPYCEKPIRDLLAAVGEKGSDTPVHFDCIMSRLESGEVLEKGDTFAYIGGGRFGVIRFSGSRHSFKIKRIVEWEDKEHRAEWRTAISDAYSAT